jgi:translation initiation factor 1A
MYQSRIRNSKQRAKQSRNRTLLEPDEGQDFAVVQDMLGNGRVRVLCSDGQLRVGRIRGSMRKYAGKVIIDKNDLVLVSHRDWEDDKVDIIHKYTHEEASKLVRNGAVSDSIVKAINQTDTDVGTSHDYVVFMDEDGIPDADDIDLDAI